MRGAPSHDAAHKHAWLDRHPHFTFHFVPTPYSWLNAVERHFAKRRLICGGPSRSEPVADEQTSAELVRGAAIFHQRAVGGVAQHALVG